MKTWAWVVACLLGVLAPKAAQAQGDLCTMFFDCVAACAEDEACINVCKQEADPEALRTYEEIVACGQMQGCFGGDPAAEDACLQEKCGPEYEAYGRACAGDAQDGVCDAALECVLECPTIDCGLECVPQAQTREAQRAISDYVFCLDENSCVDSECASAFCSEESRAIQAACGLGDAANNDANNAAGNNAAGNNAAGNNAAGDDGGEEDDNGGDEGSGEADEGGCSASTRGRGGSGGAFLLLGLVALGLRRRWGGAKS